MTCHSSGLSLSTNTEENREKFAREEALFLLQSNLFFLIAATHLIQCMYDPPFFFLSKKDLGFFQSKRNIYSLYISRLLIRDCFFPLTCLSLAKCLKRRRERERECPSTTFCLYLFFVSKKHTTLTETRCQIRVVDFFPSPESKTQFDI